MGREALLMVVSWLSFSGTLAVNSVFKDQVGAESASRLYRNAVGTVYASAAPYGSYSFQIPAISAPQAAASRVVPVKESLGFQNANAYLKDSYGNRFVEALQSMKTLPFKPFPQQYVQLQELPAHFAQPLAAAPPQYKQMPASAVGSHYRLPLQAAAPTPLNHQFSFVHPGVYAGTFKNLAPAAFSYGPQFGSVLHVPVQSAAPPQNAQKQSSTQSHSHSISETPSAFVQSTQQTVDYADTQPRELYRQYEPDESQKNGPSNQDNSRREHATAQHQPTSHKAVYADTQPNERYHHLREEHKFQTLQEAPQETYSEEESPAPARQVAHKLTTKQIVSATKETPVPTVVNGKKTVVNVKTKPPLPLLDISLLEPLTFANPLVPQVQHYLPRISEATYHKLPEIEKHEDKKYQKEFVVQKTKTYDSGVIKGKPKKPKKKQKAPEVHHIYHDDYIPAATARPTVTIEGPGEAPEISYEINSPNYKETYKEQAVKYNKETKSEPVHYTYGTNTHKEPVHYSYTHSSKEPVHIKEVRYEGKGEAPKHLVYNFKPDEHRENEEAKTESEDSGESAEHSEGSGPQRSHHRQYKEHQARPEAPKADKHYPPEHREQEYHHSPGSDVHLNIQHKNQEYHHKPSHDSHQHNVQQHRTHSGQRQPEQYHSLDVIPFQPVAQYEEDINLAAPIKVDPEQHVKQSRPELPQQPRSSPAPQHHSRPSPQHHPKTDSNPHHETPSMHVREKTKQVYIKEETPEDEDTVGEQVPRSTFGNEEDKEQDFEKAYKNSAFGFPAYDKPSPDFEKDIYKPENYGIPHEHSAFDIDHSPFQQYQEHGDDFPKETRLTYKDDRDKMKEDYFLDYSVSKPESMLDRYKNKVSYYKLYKDQKPEKYIAHEGNNNQQKQSAKLTAIPYSYYPVQGDMKQFFAQYKAAPFANAPFVFEYDYSKGMPASKDNSAHASHPLQRYNKMNTHFVEPQFQYGFEPISIPRLLDSELAAMATNNSPESEKPGTRKKIYKENFYIKKTSLSAAPNS